MSKSNDYIKLCVAFQESISFITLRIMLIFQETPQKLWEVSGLLWSKEWQKKQKNRPRLFAFQRWPVHKKLLFLTLKRKNITCLIDLFVFLQYILKYSRTILFLVYIIHSPLWTVARFLWHVTYEKWWE